MKVTSLIAETIFGQLSAASLPDWHRLEAAVRVRTLRTGDTLFLLGENHPHVHFVRQGIIKMVYETMDGKAWIKEFAEEGKFFASLVALMPGGLTSFSAQAVCDAVVEQVPYRVLLELADAHPRWQAASRRAFEVYGFRKETREKELLTCSAEERYRRFINDRHAVAARLADKDIAGYIRVTSVALSRIKKRVRQTGGTGTSGC